MNDATLAYTAGLFDGEGTVVIKGPSASAPRRHQVRVIVSMTHEPTVRWLAETFGGRARRTHAPSAIVLGRRPKYVWELNSERAARFLRDVRPWLITKAEAADVALALQARLTNGRRGQNRLPVEEVEEREALRARLALVNAGGLLP